MSKSSARNNSQTVAAFSIEAWRANLDSAALAFVSSGHRMLGLMLEARGKIELDTGREALQHAFGQAYAATYNVTFEEALKAKSVMNRVSDGMAVLKADKLPDSLPGNIQQAADACRKANPKAGRKPRQPVAKPATVEAKDVNPLALLEAALEALREQASDNSVALSLISDMVDMAQELSDELAAQASSEAELAKTA